MIDLRPLIYQGRVFREGSYKLRSRFVASFTVQIVGDSAFVSGLHGYWDLSVDRQLESELAKRGVKHVTYERRGKLKFRKLTIPTVEELDEIHRQDRPIYRRAAS